MGPMPTAVRSSIPHGRDSEQNKEEGQGRQNLPPRNARCANDEAGAYLQNLPRRPFDLSMRSPDENRCFRHRARIHPSHSGQTEQQPFRDKEHPPNQRSTSIDAQPLRTRSCCVLNLVTPFNNYLLPQRRHSCLSRCVQVNSKQPLRDQICLNLAYHGLATRIESANRLSRTRHQDRIG